MSSELSMRDKHISPVKQAKNMLSPKMSQKPVGKYSTPRPPRKDQTVEKHFIKWPVVQPAHALKEKSCQESARQLVNQLNNLRNQSEVSSEVESEGPYNFKHLLRKTNILPTDTLRQRRHNGQDNMKGADLMKVFGNNKKENVEPVVAMTDEEIVL